jgi:hypothetical protein
MKNLADEIPRRAFINAQIVQRVRDSVAFQKAVSEVSGAYGIPEYEFENPAHVASLLYCLLVVPQQLFVKGTEPFWDNEVPPSAISDYFTVNKSKTHQKILQKSSAFLRKLRNAVAHARFEIDGDLKFVFWDGDFQKGQLIVDFEVEASVVNLMRFLSDIGSKLANLQSSPSVVQ